MLWESSHSTCITFCLRNWTNLSFEVSVKSADKQYDLPGYDPVYPGRLRAVIDQSV